MTRDQKLIGVFATLFMLTAGVVTAEVVREAPPPPVATIFREVPTGPDGRLSIQLFGDTMLGGELPLLIQQRGQGPDWPFDAVRPQLAEADYVVAVAEAPISDHVEPWDPSSAAVFTSEPEAAGVMARAGVDALSLATDHAFDTGPVGLADTMRYADAAGVATFGGGPDLPRAEQPLMLRTELGTVGIVGMSESFGHRARAISPGATVLSPEAVQRGADLARAAGADWVVAVVHWGDSYQPVAPRQRYWAEVFATAGYDLVVGSGPHYVQPIEVIGSMPVLYSIGNFVYGTNGRYQQLGIPGFGLSAGFELSRGAPPRLAVRCIAADNREVAFQPRPCTPAETLAFLPALNAELEVQGDLAVLRCGTCFARRDAE
jgi:poly-gamma-glutamate synthesis protein (capsule biosynthesis protein)